MNDPNSRIGGKVVLTCDHPDYPDGIGGATYAGWQLDYL